MSALWTAFMKIFPHRLEGHAALINVGGRGFVSKPLLNGYPLSLGSDFVFLKGIYFWLYWGLCCFKGFLLLGRVVGHGGFSLQWLLLWSTGSRMCEFPWLWHTGLPVVVHGLSCSVACAIFPDQGLYVCLLHWWEDSLPLSHQGSP